METFDNSPPKNSQQMELLSPLSPGDSLARTYHKLESKLELTGNGQDSGSTCVELLAKLDPATRLWKTSQLSLVETEGDGLAEFSETWPRSGMTVNGTAYQLPTLAHLTGGTGYGLLPTHSIPTPTSQDHIERKSTSSEKLNFLTNKSVSLDRFVRFWPTPSAREPGWRYIEVVDKDGNPPTHPNQRFYDKDTGRLVQKGLPQVARMWPTPQASDNRDRGNLVSGAVKRRMEKGKQISLSQSVSETSGQLNPTWVEWLMGFPLGWTDLDA